MNIKNYRIIFLVSSLILILIAASPTLALILPLSSESGLEPFSELWILGPNHTAKNYPFNIHVNESYNVFVGVSNHMGVSSYYLLYVKFRNQTQNLLNSTSSEPSYVAPFHEFHFFVSDGEVWESSTSFSVSDVSFSTDSVSISRVNINNQTFAVGASSKWDSERNGFYFQLFFELWRYNVTSQSFQFHNRSVGIWLNITR